MQFCQQKSKNYLFLFNLCCVIEKRSFYKYKQNFQSIISLKWFQKYKKDNLKDVPCLSNILKFENKNLPIISPHSICFNPAFWRTESLK